MTDAEVIAVLDAHDALLKACLDGLLAFDEFVLAYGEFPRGYGLGNAGTESRATLERFRRRIGFHVQVAEVLSSLGAGSVAALGLRGGAREFLPKAVLLRLRHLAVRYPEFKAL
jgi:hypothetical protein